MDLPKLPCKSKPLSHNLIYLGKGGSKNDNIVRIEGCCPYYSCEEDFKWGRGYLGSSPRLHYAIEFGTSVWNKWAEKRFNLESIPSKGVFIGSYEDVVRMDLGRVHMKISFDGTWGAEPDYFYKHRINSPNCRDAKTSYVCVLKEDVGTLKKVKEYYRKINLAPTNHDSPQAIDVTPYLKYQKACKDLQEAKEEGYLIKRDLLREIFPKEHIILKDDKVYLSTLYGKERFWEEYEIIKEENCPSFEIEGDGDGPYVPKYSSTGWIFGCKLISHKIIKSCQELPEGINEVKIGQGVFTREQIKELHDYAESKTK